MTTNEIVVAVFVSTCCVPPVVVRTHDSPRMTVVVCNQVGLTNETLRIAESANTRIFHHAGVNMSWIVAGSDCTTPTPLPSKNVYFVVITPHVPQGWATSPNSMGLALRNETYRHAYVFNDRVQEFAVTMKLTRDLRISTGVVLGHIVAHELGHLLVHGKGPSGKSLMSEHWIPLDWDHAVSGILLFDPEDAKLIQNELSSNSHSH